MSAEEIAAVLAKPIDAIIGLNRREGGPQLTPVWFLWDGTYFWFTTSRKRAKYPNLRRDPNMSVIVDDPQSHKYIAAYGLAKIITDNVADLMWPILKKYTPADQLGKWTATTQDPARVVIQLKPDKIVTN